MTKSEIDLLDIKAGSVTAPAGCGKTHLIAEALRRNRDSRKPVLVLTHTNAGVAALRGRLEKDRVQKASYRLTTLDGFAMRLTGLFPTRSKIKAETLQLANPTRDYAEIRAATTRLFEGKHVEDILEASFSRLIVDEYQDCSTAQHTLVSLLADILPTCVLGDPMQAIFNWAGNEAVDWDRVVRKRFAPAGNLQTPWRWKNAGTEKFGHWLLDVRAKLLKGESIDLSTAPPEVEWVNLDGTQDWNRQLQAARTAPLSKDGSVLLIAKSKSKSNQWEFASKTPGAVTVESVDLRDVVEFAQVLDLRRRDALEQVVTFASKVMTNVGGPDLIRRVETLQKGRARRGASDAEDAALALLANPTHASAANLIVAINKEAGVRVYRPAVLRAALKALQACDGKPGSFHTAAIRAREQNRMLGRPLPRRAVGSTLLLKGLEADVSVILDTTEMDAKNLYVAMTRGARKLVICSKERVLKG